MTPEAPPHEAPLKPPRNWLIALVAVALAAIAAVAVWAIYDANQTDDAGLARATEIMDEWNAAWNDNDHHAAAALVTEDAVYTLTVVNWPSSFEDDEMLRSRAAIRVFVARNDIMVGRSERLGEGTQTPGGMYVFPQRFGYNGLLQTGPNRNRTRWRSRLPHRASLDAGHRLSDNPTDPSVAIHDFGPTRGPPRTRTEEDAPWTDGPPMSLPRRARGRSRG
jgi:hypothetical protein